MPDRWPRACRIGSRHADVSEIGVLTAPATLFKTKESSRSAGPQKRTKAPRCKLKRGVRGCEPATRTPLLLSHGTELSLAWPCPVGAAGCTQQIMVKVGHLRPAVMAMVLRLEGSQADMRHHSTYACCRGDCVDEVRELAIWHRTMRPAHGCLIAPKRAGAQDRNQLLRASFLRCRF